MPGESLSFDITASDRASSKFRDVGRAAADAGAKIDFAAGSMKVWDDSQTRFAKAAKTSSDALKTHVKADQLYTDALRVASGKTTVFTKLMTDQSQAIRNTAAEAQKASGRSGLASLGERLGQVTGTGGVSGGGAIGLAIALGAVLSPVITTVGFGLGGLALAAAGVAKPIADAAQKSGGLAKNLHTLDGEQKTVAFSLLGLGKTFGGFEQSLKPVLLQDFNAGIRIAGHLLHDVQPVAQATGKALGQVLQSVDQEFQSSTWQQFFAFMARTAGPDIQLLGQNFTDLLQVLPPLIQDLQPLAHAFLVVSDDTIKAAGGVQKFYDSFQKNVPISNQNVGNFLKSLDQDVVSLTNHIPGARAVNDWLTNVQHTLTGTGDAAQKAVPPVQHAAQAVSDMMKTTVTTVTPVDRLGKAASSTSFSISEYGKNANLTVTPADRLGRVADVSAASIGHVATAADFANIKIIDVRNSVKSLTTALSKGLDPLVNYSNALLTQQGDAKNLADALKASGNQIGFRTQKQRDSFSAANTYIKDLENTAQQALASHQGIGKEISSLENSLPALEHAQSHSKLYWQEVRTLISYLDKLRAERNIREAVTVFGSGTWSLSQPGGKLAGPTGTASGWMVSGGTPGKDSVPIMAMPGELVVPTKMVASGAVDHLRGSIPGFASGGIVPSYSGSVAGLPPWVSRNQAASVRAVTTDIANAFARAFRAVFRAAQAGAPGSLGGPASASAAQAQAYARSRLGAYGWGADQMPPLIALWNQESGWNRFARNPTSGAYGIPQAYPPGKMGAAANPPTSSAAAQINWGLGYIRGTYGSPSGAEAHELSHHWYDKGGFLPPGLSLAYNGTGRPEQVIPHSRSGGTATVVLEIRSGGAPADALLAELLRKYIRTRGGNVQVVLGRN